MKALYTKREYNSTATIVKALPGDAGFVCSEKGTEDEKPTAGFRR